MTNKSIEYIRRNGKGTFYLNTPIKENSICQLLVGIKTPSDPHGKCLVRMDIDFINNYKTGTFDEPQEIEFDCDVGCLKTLKAFPFLLDIFTNSKTSSLEIRKVIDDLEWNGFNKSDSVERTYGILKQIYDTREQN